MLDESLFPQHGFDVNTEFCRFDERFRVVEVILGEQIRGQRGRRRIFAHERNEFLLLLCERRSRSTIPYRSRIRRDSQRLRRRLRLRHTLISVVADQSRFRSAATAFANNVSIVTP